MTTIIPTAQKVSWRTVALNGSVWALRRGHWYAAVVTGRRGRKTCCVTFLDTGKGVQRSYEELAGRATSKQGADRPADPVRDSQEEATCIS